MSWPWSPSQHPQQPVVSYCCKRMKCDIFRCLLSLWRCSTPESSPSGGDEPEDERRGDSRCRTGWLDLRSHHVCLIFRQLEEEWEEEEEGGQRDPAVGAGTCGSHLWVAPRLISPQVYLNRLPETDDAPNEIYSWDKFYMHCCFTKGNK